VLRVCGVDWQGSYMPEAGCGNGIHPEGVALVDGPTPSAQFMMYK
jgi:hypothetical protein